MEAVDPEHVVAQRLARDRGLQVERRNLVGGALDVADGEVGLECRLSCAVARRIVHETLEPVAEVVRVGADKQFSRFQGIAIIASCLGMPT